MNTVCHNASDNNQEYTKLPKKWLYIKSRHLRVSVSRGLECYKDEEEIETDVNVYVQAYHTVLHVYCTLLLYMTFTC